MKITVTNDQDRALIAVEGSLNTNTAPDLERAVEQAFSSATSATFDLNDLDYISSAGLRVLMVAYKKATACGGTINVCGASEEVQEVFEVTGFSDLFDVA